MSNCEKRAESDDHCVQPIDGRSIFTSLRHEPKGEQVFAVCHMEGKPIEDIDPPTLPVPGLDGFGWRLAFRTHSIGPDYTGGPITLKDSMALACERTA